MIMRRAQSLFVVSTSLLLSLPVAAGTPVDTAFTFQGQLKDGGVPANGPHNFVFRLFNDSNVQIGADIAVNGHPVVNGLFSADLDFGPGVFTGDKRELEVQVNGVILTPRQPLNAAPYAMYALNGPGGTGVWSINGTNIHNANAGNVGIGTNAPAANLEVRSFSSPRLRVAHVVGQVGAPGTGVLELKSNRVVSTTPVPHGAVRFLDGADAVLSSIQFLGIPIPGLHFDTDSTTRMAILSSGRIGMGTTFPDRALQIGDVATPNSEGMIRLESRSGTQGSNRAWDIGVPETDGNSSGIGYSFIIDDLAAGTEPEFMIKWGSGNVGIGTVSPQSKLHVAGTADVNLTGGNGIAMFGTPAEENLAIDNNEIMARNGTNTSTLYLNNEGGDVRIGQNGGTSTVFVSAFQTSGRVGIGGPPVSIDYAAGPPFRPLLTVHGDMRLEDVPVWDGPNANDLTWGAGSADGVSFNPDKLLISREGSSRRYKEGIRRLDEDFSKILSVEPRRYQMRPGYGPPDAWSFGYIAEELEEAGLRDFVIYDEQGIPDGVQYKKIALYVNEVVKSHQKMIEQLQAEVATLQKRVGELSDRNQQQSVVR
jgi:hypothetical protein